MKAVLLSIQPYYVFLIIARTMGWNIQQEKIVDVRKGYPKDKEWNKETYIYCSKNKKSFNRIPKHYQHFMKRLLGKVIGEFICDWVKEIEPHCDMGYVNQYIHHYPAIIGDDCLSFQEMKTYLGCRKGYDWHISNLKIYDKPKELSEFKSPYICKTGKKLGCWSDFCKTRNFDCVKREAERIKRPPQSWYYVEV